MRSLGQVVGPGGPSGAGKTTLVNLLPRFLQPNSGQVLIDGVPLPQWDLAYLRQQFAMVSQDVVMFNDNVAANVALGSASINEERVWQCLEAPIWPSMCVPCPRAFTPTGAQRQQLSGGQQRGHCPCVVQRCADFDSGRGHLRPGHRI